MNGNIFLNEKLILLFFLILYTVSVGPDPILGDSLAFTVIASKGFDLATNATNHFLYMNVLALLHKIIPFIDPHYLFVGISVMCSVLTLFFLKKLIMLFEIKELNANLLIVLFGFSFTFWRVSIITEVYSFYILFATLFLYKIFLYKKERKMMDFYYSALLLGIMFLIHIQTLLLLPFYMYFLYENFKDQKKNIIVGVVIPAAIFSILLIPVIQGRHNFMAIFTDNSWGGSFFDLKVKTFVKSLGRNFVFLVYNFLFFLFFIIAGFRNLEYKKYFLVALLPYVFFILKHDVSDSYVFHLIPYLFVIILIGKGLENIHFNKKYALICSIPLIYFLTFKIINYTGFGQNINKEIGFKGGTRYFFFPPLRNNPKIGKFIEAYNNNLVKEKEKLERQYEYALEWIHISKEYNH